MIRAGEGERAAECAEWLNLPAEVQIEVLRRHAASDPESGDTMLLRVPPNAGCRGEGIPLMQVLVLAGRARLGERWLDAGSQLSALVGCTRLPLEAGAEGAEILAVVRPPGPRVAASPEGGREEHVWPRPGALTTKWGYLDLQDHTDRLPLHYERTRGEAAWLLRVPASYRGAPTRAEGVALEAFVLTGSVSIADGTYGPGGYLYFDAGAIPQQWRSETGGTLWLHTIAGPDVVEEINALRRDGLFPPG